MTRIDAANAPVVNVRRLEASDVALVASIDVCPLDRSGDE